MALRYDDRHDADDLQRTVRPLPHAEGDHAPPRRHRPVPGVPDQECLRSVRHAHRRLGLRRPTTPAQDASPRVLSHVLCRYGAVWIATRPRVRAGVLRPGPRLVRQRHAVRYRGRIALHPPDAGCDRADDRDARGKTADAPPEWRAVAGW